MTELRAKMRGKVHGLDPKGKRQTRCGRSVGNIIEEGGTGDPVIMESGGNNILVSLGVDLVGVTCHWCRWGRNNVRIPSY